VRRDYASAEHRSARRGSPARSAGPARRHDVGRPFRLADGAIAAARRAREAQGTRSEAEGAAFGAPHGLPPRGPLEPPTDASTDPMFPAMSAPPILRLQNVESAYGPIRAIRGVSLAVDEGRIGTVLGANGAGKSTILKTISGIIDPRKGSVEFRGADITAKDPAEIVRRGLTHVPEGREVFPLLSVHDNLLMGAYTRSDRDAVARDLESVYAYFPILRERAGQEAGLLSGGQQQMLSVSRAMMAAPTMILLDEPSLGLSPLLTREIFEIVVRINRERGTTLLLVEQNAHMALAVADYGYVLENGRIVMEDTCERLREKEDIREFYLGIKEAGTRGERRWKRRKTWR